MNKNKKPVRRIVFEVLLAVCLVSVLAGLLMPARASTGRPTRKIRALWGCRDYAAFVRNSATNNQYTLDLLSLTNEASVKPVQAGAFIRLLLSAEDLANTGENYLIRTNCSTVQTSRTIVIVCEKPFDYDQVNKSLWAVFKRNQAHAVGFSDGKNGLISPVEFQNLNRSGFVPLAEVATNFLSKF